MRHWIIDREARALSSWSEALPGATLVRSSEIESVKRVGEGVIWCRVRPGDALSALVSRIAPGPGQRLVFLCDVPDEALTLEALSLGASGCCNTHAAPEVLAQVSTVVGNGGLWVGQALLQRLVGATTQRLASRTQRPHDDAWAERLSEREIQVAQLVANGASNREIAEQLAITERTVKAHLTAIFEKLAVRDRLQLSLKINGLKVDA